MNKDKDIGLYFEIDKLTYEKSLGAFHFGGRIMIIETLSALKLIGKYFK